MSGNGGAAADRRLPAHHRPCDRNVTRPSPKVPVTKYLSKVDEVLRQSMLYRAGGDQDNLFLMLLRATNLITETIPKHKDFRPDAPGYLKFHRLLGAMVTELEQLKRTLDARDVAMARARKEAAADAARPSPPAAGGAGPGGLPLVPPSLQQLALDDIRVHSGLPGGEAAAGLPPAMETGSPLPGSPAFGPGCPKAAFPGSPHGVVALAEQGSPVSTPMPYPVVGMRQPGPPPAPMEAPSAPSMPTSSSLAPVLAAPGAFAPPAVSPAAAPAVPASVLPGRPPPADVSLPSAPVGTASAGSGSVVPAEAAAGPRSGSVLVSAPQEPVGQVLPGPSPSSGSEAPFVESTARQGDSFETTGSTAAPRQKEAELNVVAAQGEGGPGPSLPAPAGDAPRQVSGEAAAAQGVESQHEEARDKMPKKRKSSGRGEGATFGAAQPRGSDDVREAGTVPRQGTGQASPEAVPQKQTPPELPPSLRAELPSREDEAAALAAQREVAAAQKQATAQQEAAAAAAAAQQEAAAAAAAAQQEAAAAAAAAQQEAQQQAAAAAAAAQQHQQAQAAAAAAAQQEAQQQAAAAAAAAAQQQQAQAAAAAAAAQQQQQAQAAAAAAQQQAQQQAAAATAAQGWVGPSGQQEQYLSPVQHYPSNLPTAVDWRRHPQIITSGGYPVAPPAMVAATNVAPPRPQPHQPSTGVTAPSAQDSRADHMTLDQRLKAYGLQEKTIKGDGNCQFRSLSDQLFGTPDRHVEVRRMVIAQLMRNTDDYSVFVPDDYSDYVRKMSKDGEWGDHLTLQAASDVYGRRICVLSTYEKNFLIEITPKNMRHPRVLWLSFWAEVHYNSIYPASS